MGKKSSKHEKPAAEKAKSKSKEELSDKDLEQVAGGANIDYLLTIGSIPGETQGNKGGSPTESVSLNFTKVSTKYVKQ